jgi:hypothetical protein
VVLLNSAQRGCCLQINFVCRADGEIIESSKEEKSGICEFVIGSGDMIKGEKQMLPASGIRNLDRDSES